MSESNRSNISRQIQEAVQDALATGDFKKLNETVSKTINNTVNNAVSEAKKQMKQGAAQSSQWQSSREDWMDRQAHNNGNPQTAQPPVSKVNTKQLPAVRTRRVGNVAGILYTTFGGIGLGVSSLALLSLLMITGIGGIGVAHGVLAALLAGSVGMIKAGTTKRNRLGRADRYVQICGKNSYVDIADLASHTGKKKGKVLKDVKQMIHLGIFPEGHLDEQNSCLMLTDETYREYLKLQKQRKALEIEEKVAEMKKTREEKNEALQKRNSMFSSRKNTGSVSEDTAEDALSSSTDLAESERAAFERELDQISTSDIEDQELVSMIEEGKDYIRRIRIANDEVEGAVFSDKLYELEKLLKEIFLRIKEHSEQMPQMQKFMKYYLPTTLKLVESYAAFDKISVPGEEVLSAKAEIEKALDTIIQAFAELLNKLFQAEVYDVTTDAQVLQTMLAKEGLTKDGLTKNN